MYLEKAQMIEHYSALIHTIQTTFPYPSVIRLRSYIKKPFKGVALTRKNILMRDSHHCQYCGKNNTFMTLDHVVPRSAGGKDTWENLVCACVRCNNKKGNRTPSQAGMQLLSKPKRPSHLLYLQAIAEKSHPSWHDYLYMN